VNLVSATCEAHCQQLVQHCPVHLAYCTSRIALAWNAALPVVREVGCDRKSSDWPDCPCGMSKLCTLYRLVLNKSWSVEVPYTGRFWLCNAMRNVCAYVRWAEQRCTNWQCASHYFKCVSFSSFFVLLQLKTSSKYSLCSVSWLDHLLCIVVSCISH